MPADKINLKAIIDLLNSEEALARIVQAIKSSGTKKRDATIETVAKSFIADAIRQVSDDTTDSHADLSRSIPASVVGAVEKLAAWGIPANHITQEGWLNGRFTKSIGAVLCVAMPGVRGLERLLMENGAQSIKSFAIRRQDRFTCIEGTDERVEFERNLLPDASKPNDIIGSCGIVKMKDGRQQIITVPLKETVLAADAKRMTVEAAAKYRAQRPVMREAMRTFLIDVVAVRNLMDYDQKNLVLADQNETLQSVVEEKDAVAKSLDIPVATGLHVESPAAEAPKAAIKSPVAEKLEQAQEEGMGQSASEAAAAAVAPEINVSEIQRILRVASGVKSRMPNTPLGMVKEEQFDLLAKWARRGQGNLPASEQPFYNAILEMTTLLEAHKITFQEAKALAVASEEEAAAASHAVPVGARV